MPKRLRASQARVGGGSTARLTAGESCGRGARVWRAALGLGVVALTLAVGSPTAYAATISVNTTADELNSDGDCSLREAIEAANMNAAVDACAAGVSAPTVDVISFGVSGTIALTSGQLAVTDDLKLDGPGATNLTISGNNSSRVFFVPLRPRLQLELNDVTVANGSSDDGGGILAAGDSLTITRVIFSGNSGGVEGGGVAYFGSGTLTITDSVFLGNNANSGGAIHSETSRTIVDDTTFSENTAFGFGGAIRNQATFFLTDSTFSGNSAGFGGAIFTIDDLSVTNSTFSNNVATFNGGGIHNQATLTVTNSTFSRNSAEGVGGGGLRNEGVLTLTNSIVANSPTGGNCSGSLTDGGGNLSWPDSTCPGLNVDPLLDPAGLQDNGGPTKTVALQSGSPAIDAAVAANCPPTDQRGVSRPQGAGCDIGAFELVTNRPPNCASVIASPNRLWPPNHRLVLIALAGATDPDGDTVTLTVTGATQDEPVSGLGPGDVAPDAQAGTQSNTVFVRAERADTGDGRVYRVSFTGSDRKGGSCSGTVKVSVPKTQRSTAVDSAPPSYNSFGS
jgi:CSLREA domain-containing protein